MGFVPIKIFQIAPGALQKIIVPGQGVAAFEWDAFFSGDGALNESI
jgi:hypothetical protein